MGPLSLGGTGRTPCCTSPGAVSMAHSFPPASSRLYSLLPKINRALTPWAPGMTYPCALVKHILITAVRNTFPTVPPNTPEKLPQQPPPPQTTPSAVSASHLLRSSVDFKCRAPPSELISRPANGITTRSSINSVPDTSGCGCVGPEAICPTFRGQGVFPLFLLLQSGAGAGGLCPLNPERSPLQDLPSSRQGEA